MLVSMTGFGHGESGNQRVQVVAEVRSVNNRYLDVAIKLPKFLTAYENAARELIRQKVNRGRISLFVSSQAADFADLDIKVDYEVARGYKKMLDNLKENLDLSDEIGLDHILKFSEIFTPIEEIEPNDEFWPFAEEAINHALDEMNRMRALEGENLAVDLLQRLEQIEKYVGEIEEISQNRMPVEFQSMKERIKEILQDPDVDANRLEMEIAVLADRLDVTEECVRFHSHVQLFRDFVNGREMAGRRLNFLIQEMNREANTIGSKANNAEISHRVVFVKEEIEKIREQVQNIE